MKAIRVSRFGGSEVLELVELAQPTPQPGEVVVRLEAIGVNPVETYLRSGSNPQLPLPYTPGLDGAGVILSVGPEVTDRKAGDRVYITGSRTGSYAEFTACRSSDTHLLPTNITFEQGAALNIPYATAYRALHQKAHALAGETVLIHGASGGVGIAAIQIARNIGLNVIGTVGSETGEALALANGAHQVVFHNQPDYLAKILALTNGHGVDLILEMLANVNLGKDLTLLTKGGRVVVIGSRGKVEITPRDLMGRDASIHGMMVFNASSAELASVFAGINAGLANGTLRPVVGKQFSLADAAKAHEAVMASGAQGKIILKP